MEQLIRERFDKIFAADTAYPGSWDPAMPAKGHCAIVALTVQRLAGGELASAPIGGSHWFNHKVKLETEHLVDLDFTGDQFGFPKIRTALAGRLYFGFKVRSLEEVNEETRKRFELFWERFQALGPLVDAIKAG